MTDVAPPAIHPTAVVHPKATLGDGVVVGAYCVIGEHVTLHKGVRLISHVVVDGLTTIGDETVVYPFSVLGTPPQDLKYCGEATQLIVGERNRIREHVTMNPGTAGGGGITRIGDDSLFMVGVHVAHDCQLGNHLVLANNATLAGHVSVGDHTVIGGLSAVHQFVRIGAHAMIGGMSGVENDVVPFGLVKGERAFLAGINLIGLERRGFPREDIRALQAAWKNLFAGTGTLVERMRGLEQQEYRSPLVKDVLDFLRNRTSRALCQPRDGSV